jgi:hypothetical protein
MELDATFGHVLLFVWSIVATTIGIIGSFFRDKFVKLNVWWALKLYEMTGIPLFKTQAAHLRNTDWSFLIFTLGVAFVIGGVLTFISLFNIHVIDWC